TLNHRGHLTRARGRLVEALRDYRAAADLFARLTDEGQAGDCWEGLAGSRVNLGLTLHGLGRPAEAEAEYATALALFEGLAAENAPNARYALAACANDFGRLLEDLGRPAEAIQNVRRAVELWKQLTTEHRTVPAYQQALATGLSNLGRLS